eukprot:1983521-Amphidinium_carterae.1
MRTRAALWRSLWHRRNCIWHGKEALDVIAVVLDIRALASRDNAIEVMVKKASMLELTTGDSATLPRIHRKPLL